MKNGLGVMESFTPVEVRIAKRVAGLRLTVCLLLLLLLKLLVFLHDISFYLSQLDT